MITGKNFSGKPNPDVGGETEFLRCNFTQPQPVDNAGSFEGVPIFPGSGPMTFTDCNLTNCVPPAGSVTTNCNLSVIELNKVTSTEAVSIDGEGFTIEHHSNRWHGRYDPVSEAHVYEPVPVDSKEMD